MNPVRKKRLIIIVAILLGVAATVGLGLTALQQNINLFYTPTQIANGEAPQGARIRAGGLVKDGSLRRSEDSLTVDFLVTDGDADGNVVAAVDHDDWVLLFFRRGAIDAYAY